MKKMKMKKWISTALIVSLLAVNSQAMGNVNAFTPSDYVKSEVSAFDEQNGSVTTPTTTPKVLGDYAVTYINEGETTTVGWYPAGRTTTITLKTPEDRGGRWCFAGWEDTQGNLHEAGTEVEVYDVASATFTAVWQELPLGDFYATYIDGEEESRTGCYPIGYPNAITLKEPDAKEGYIFVGWKDYKGDLHQPGESVSISNVPTATFTAVWEKVEEIVTTPCAIYSIVYVDGEYSNSCSDTVLNGSADFTIIEPTPKDGYSFLGWKNGTKLYQPGEIVSLGDLSSREFTAVWLKLQETATPSAVVTPTPTAPPTMTPSPTPTITSTPTIIADYDVTYIDGDKETHRGWYPAGRITTITLIEPEPKEGYVFMGWKDCEGNIYQPGEEAGVCDVPSATFTAVWEKVQETIMPDVVVTTTPTITPTPTILGDYYVIYIDGADREQFGFYPAGRTSKADLKEPEPKEGYVFVGWKDYKGNIYQPGEEVEFVDMPSATFTAVWEKMAEVATSGAIATETPAPNVTPTVTPTMKPTAKPVVKKAKVKITTSKKKKFVVGKKYTIKAKRTNTSKKLKWSVSNKKYATIDKNKGILKAKKAGKVTITVTCGKVKDKIKIVIKKK